MVKFFSPEMEEETTYLNDLCVRYENQPAYEALHGSI